MAIVKRSTNGPDLKTVESLDSKQLMRLLADTKQIRVVSICVLPCLFGLLPNEEIQDIIVKKSGLLTSRIIRVRHATASACIVANLLEV